MQLTFADQPFGEVVSQPNGELLALTRDRVGNKLPALPGRSGLIFGFIGLISPHSLIEHARHTFFHVDRVIVCICNGLAVSI